MSKEQESRPVRVRQLHGCLPLFLLGSVALIGCGLWLLPVKKAERLRPSGEGRIFYHSSGLINYEAVRKSPLTLPSRSVAEDVFYRDSVSLRDSVKRDADLRKAPPMDILPLVADSAVISREILLELPPVEAASAGEDTAGEATPSITSDQEVQP
ncbi:MAG: hypothetical protein IJ498_09235 [Akkermansia sp.]|nr:hypothetical protein [Akkermansia sp.]